MSYRGDNLAGHGGASTPFGHIDEWADLAVDYVDGTASRSDRELIEDHLAVCPSCAARLSQQTQVISLFAHVDQVEAPRSLEDTILGELLFPSQVVARPLPETAKVASLWQRRLRAWVPAAAAVAAVLVGLVAWGVFGPAQQRDYASTTSTEVASVYGTQEKQTNETALGSGAADSYATTAAPATTAAAAAATSTTAAAATTTMSATVAAAAGPTSEVPTTIVDKKAMVSSLKQASGPVYLAFSPLPGDTPGASGSAETATTAAGASSGQGSGGGGEGAQTTVDVPAAGQSGASGQASPEWVKDLMAEVTSFTEMGVLPADIADGQSVFAGYLDHRNVTAFIELLQSIASSHRLRVTLQNEPGADNAETALRIGEHKGELPLLICHVIPQPATYRYNFTTSTLPAAAKSGGQAAYPDEAGTHVLTVLFFQP